ncbi:unnamed protein product [Urochloa decumbens]|uniref:LOB domain-containing protein n=1 Tax=Urochloa decumbens TaxID=240449 RepID=A0ABC9BSL6_9POAL
MSSSSSATGGNMEAAAADHQLQQLVDYGGGSSGSNPRRCAACKYLRRRCAPDCVLAPYFPASQPRRYADVHAVFGTSNATRLLQSLPVQERGRAADTMAAEARWRVQDPVYGCTGIIDRLQQEIRAVQHELATTRALLAAVHVRGGVTAVPPAQLLRMPPPLPPPPPPQAPLAPPAAVAAPGAAHAGVGGGHRASGHEEEDDDEAPPMDPDEFLDLDGRF